jgi:2'-5' RNA ligase
MEISFALVLFPDKALLENINELRKDLYNKYGIRNPAKYNKVPPHISLIFKDSKISESDFLLIRRQLKRNLSYFKPFKIKVNGIGLFVEHSRSRTGYLYLKIRNSKELEMLFKIASDVVKETTGIMQGVFVPHITIVRSNDNRKIQHIAKEYRDIKFVKEFLVEGLFVGTQDNPTDKWKFTYL